MRLYSSPRFLIQSSRYLKVQVLNRFWNTAMPFISSDSQRPFLEPISAPRRDAWHTIAFQQWEECSNVLRNFTRMETLGLWLMHKFICLGISKNSIIHAHNKELVRLQNKWTLNRRFSDHKFFYFSVHLERSWQLWHSFPKTKVHIPNVLFGFVKRLSHYGERCRAPFGYFPRLFHNIIIEVDFLSTQSITSHMCKILNILTVRCSGAYDNSGNLLVPLFIRLFNSGFGRFGFISEKCNQIYTQLESLTLERSTKFSTSY